MTPDECGAGLPQQTVYAGVKGNEAARNSHKFIFSCPCINTTGIDGNFHHFGKSFSSEMNSRSKIAVDDHVVLSATCVQVLMSSVNNLLTIAS